MRGLLLAEREFSYLVDAGVVYLCLHLVKLQLHFKHDCVQLVLTARAPLKLGLLNDPQRSLYLGILMSHQESLEISVRL